MRPVIHLSAVIVLSLSCESARAADAAIACAAFASDGTAAGAVLADGQVNLTILPPGGAPAGLTAPMNGAPSECRVLFSPDGEFIVVTGGEDAEEVLVADARRRKWLKAFSISPRPDFRYPLVIGFFKDSLSLLVRGVGEQKSTPPVIELKAELIALDGSRAGSGTVTHSIKGRLRGQSPGYWDSTHNRLWFINFPQFCPMASVPIIGEGTDGPHMTVKTLDGIPCAAPLVITYPDADTVVTASDRGSHEIVCRVDLSSASGEKLLLPRYRGDASYRAAPPASLSPDGTLFAYRQSVSKRSIFDVGSSGGDYVVVVQVRPLRVVRIVKPERLNFVSGLAAYHSPEKSGLLVRWEMGDGRWELVDLSSK